jgi:hypothetical protein
MSDRQLADKLIGLANPVLGSARAEEIAATCWRLTELADFRAVPNLTVPA